MGRKRSSFDDSAYKNKQSFIYYFDMLKNLAINSITWENLPDTVNERFMELCLIDKGYCLYFNDEVIGNLALPCTISGPLNVYNIPMERRAFASNGYNRRCTIEDSVIIYNNYLHTPDINAIEYYAYKLYEIDRAIDTNVKLQKFPGFVAGSESQRLTLNNLMMKYQGNEPLIFGDKNLDLESLKVLNFDVPYVSDKLQFMKHQIFNDALTYLGIENSNQDKKERLVADEVGSNYGVVEAQRMVRINAREEGADEINKMFGTNLKPKFNSSLITMVNRVNVEDEYDVYESETDEEEVATNE